MGRFMTLSANVSASNFPNTRGGEVFAVHRKIFPSCPRFKIFSSHSRFCQLLQFFNTQTQFWNLKLERKYKNYLVILNRSGGSLEDEGCHNIYSEKKHAWKIVPTKTENWCSLGLVHPKTNWHTEGKNWNGGEEKKTRISITQENQ